jgi:hypothetical protein
MLNLERHNAALSATHNTGKNAKNYLYQLYSERVASMRVLPFDPNWDGATNFETK